MSSTRRPDVPDVPEPVYEGEKWSAEPSAKKRKGNETWARNIAKKQRDSGQEYVSVTTKATKPAASVGAPCACPKKCFDVVGADKIQGIFREYWAMASHNAQSSYLATRVSRKEVARHRINSDDSRRQFTLSYTVCVDAEKVVVCKKAFCSIHGISAKRVENVVVKVGSTGVAPVDKRGKQPSHNKASPEVNQLIEAHIKSLPTCSSHYSRAKSRDKVYLPPGYTHHTCYDLFRQKCAEDGVPDQLIASFHLYSRRFSTFNIGQNPPMIDTCSTCDKLDREIEVAKAEKDASKESSLSTEKSVHLMKAKVARDIMSAYSEDNDQKLCAIAVDLQQTLVTPRLTTNVAYYKRKMWTYNFSIHNLKEANKAHMYVWNESIAKRGSSDIGSCLMHYIANSVPAHCSKLVIFSDNCGGQNKNINLSLLLLRYIHSGRFSLIKQYYLMPGHSYLPCDRDFGVLEQHFRGQEVYTTPHYVHLMRAARREHPFEVIEMDRDTFFDLDALQGACTKAQMAKAGFKNARMFQYTAEYKMGFRVCLAYFEDHFDLPTYVKLQKGRGATYQREKFDLSAIDLQLKYPEGVKLKDDKLADLNFLLRFVPVGHRWWYNDLFAAQGALTAQEDEDPDDPDDVLDF